MYLVHHSLCGVADEHTLETRSRDGTHNKDRAVGFPRSSRNGFDRAALNEMTIRHSYLRFGKRFVENLVRLQISRPQYALR